MATVICHTEECENADIPIDVQLWYLDDDGNQVPITNVTCGACGQPITDISAPEA